MLIQSNAKGDGFVRVDEEVRPGGRAMVRDGLLKNFAGVFELELEEPDRIRSLLEAVSYQAHIEFDRDMVKRAG